MTSDHVPPGWPAQVPPPPTPGWQRHATAYLLDLCPPDYRAHGVLTRQPVVLAYLATRHVRASLAGHGEAVAGMRSSLADLVPASAVEQALEALDVEHARLLAQRRAADLLAAALAGHRHVPRL